VVANPQPVQSQRIETGAPRLPAARKGSQNPAPRLIEPSASISTRTRAPRSRAAPARRERPPPVTSAEDVGFQAHRLPRPLIAGRVSQEKISRPARNQVHSEAASANIVGRIWPRPGFAIEEAGSRLRRTSESRRPLTPFVQNSPGADRNILCAFPCLSTILVVTYLGDELPGGHKFTHEIRLDLPSQPRSRSKSGMYNP